MSGTVGFAWKHDRHDRGFILWGQRLTFDIDEIYSEERKTPSLPRHFGGEVKKPKPLVLDLNSEAIRKFVDDTMSSLESLPKREPEVEQEVLEIEDRIYEDCDRLEEIAKQYPPLKPGPSRFKVLGNKKPAYKHRGRKR